MLSASLNGPYTEVGGVSAGSNLIRGGGLFGNRPTGVNTSYSVPVYVDVHGMLRDHGLPNVRLDSVHADANRGLIFQTQPGSLKREALHQVQRRIQ